MDIPEDLLDQVMASVRAFVLRTLPYDASDPSVTDRLAKMDATDLLVTRFNWTWRRVTRHPRIVHLSKEFVANPLRNRYAQPLTKLLTDIYNGADIGPYLSRKISIVLPPAGGKARRRRDDIDLMLNAWGIYHLHISSDLDADGFVTRSQHLLFVVFRRGHAFVLDIMPHRGAWAQERTIRIILDNWPAAPLVQKLEGVIGLSRPLNDEERLTLLCKHVNTGIEIDGAVYMPAGGIASSGISIDAVRNADWVIFMLEEFVGRLQADPAFLPNMMRERGIAIPPRLELEFFSDEGGFGLIEKSSRTLFKLQDANSVATA